MSWISAYGWLAIEHAPFVAACSGPSERSARSDYEALEALPQGNYTPIDKVLLQAPGVSCDSAVSNPDYHVRNEYANVQYRINGILLPEGVSGLGPVLETGFIGNLI